MKGDMYTWHLCVNQKCSEFDSHADLNSRALFNVEKECNIPRSKNVIGVRHLYAARCKRGKKLKR